MRAGLIVARSFVAQYRATRLSRLIVLHGILTLTGERFLEKAAESVRTAIVTASNESGPSNAILLQMTIGSI